MSLAPPGTSADAAATAAAAAAAAAYMPLAGMGNMGAPYGAPPGSFEAVGPPAPGSMMVLPPPGTMGGGISAAASVGAGPQRSIDLNKRELANGLVVQTTNPNILVTPVPTHWRKNKSLPETFRVLSLVPIPNDTLVEVKAFNEVVANAEVRNNTAKFVENVAQFADLRFKGRSGRGKRLTLSIHIHTDPPTHASLPEAIKVTVDGPRQPRRRPFVWGWGRKGGGGGTTGGRIDHADALTCSLYIPLAA